MRRTWAEIDLDALEHNYRVARQKIGPGVKYLGVVKADAYGHGAVQISRKLEQLGADYLAVSSLDEARELRHGGITMPILILGHTPPEMVPQLIAYNITQAVSAKAKAEEYSAEAVRCGGTLRVHIKVDTGMSRLGFLVRGEHFGGQRPHLPHPPLRQQRRADPLPGDVSGYGASRHCPVRRGGRRPAAGPAAGHESEIQHFHHQGL